MHAIKFMETNFFSLGIPRSVPQNQALLFICCFLNYCANPIKGTVFVLPTKIVIVFALRVTLPRNELPEERKNILHFT